MEHLAVAACLQLEGGAHSGLASAKWKEIKALSFSLGCLVNMTPAILGAAAEQIPQKRFRRSAACPRRHHQHPDSLSLADRPEESACLFSIIYHLRVVNLRSSETFSCHS